MEKLQLSRKRKTDAEKPRMDPLMRALKALHSAGSPEAMTPEELEHQRRNQEILGRLTAPMAGMEYEELSIGAMPAAWTRLKAPHGGSSTAMAAAIPAATWVIPGCCPPSWPMSPGMTC